MSTAGGWCHESRTQQIMADKVEVQAENLRKTFLAMAKDIRVILNRWRIVFNMRKYHASDTEKAERKLAGDAGYLCTNRRQVGNFQGEGRAG